MVQTGFPIYKHVIKLDESVRHLGDYLDGKLKFALQLSSLCMKAAKQLYAFECFAHPLGYTSRLTLYRAYIKSNTINCLHVWHFCSKMRKNHSKLGGKQYRVLRFVYKDYRSSYVMLLDQANPHRLHPGRLRSLPATIHRAAHVGGPYYVNPP